jgi:hypothetical protein
MSRSFFLLLSILFFCFIGLISCNNWLLSQSRSAFSSTTWPWVPKVGNTPHYQVAQDQKFTLAWSVGHGNNAALYGLSSFTYVVMFHFDDQIKVPGTNKAMMDLIKTYINDAGKYASTDEVITNQPGWHRTQMLPNQFKKDGKTANPSFWVPQTGLAVTGNGGYNDTTPTLNEYYENYGTQYAPGDSKYIHQDSTLLSTQCRGGINFCNTSTNFVPPGQWVHNSMYDSHNARLEYQHPSPALSWIESVHKFQISVAPQGYTNTYNTAYFRIPARKGPGNYMVMYIWTGYSDVIDVNVMATTTPNPTPYGKSKPSTSPTYTRIDHCELNFIQNTIGGCRKVDPLTMDISACVKDCTNNGGCDSIQVTRYGKIAGTLNTAINIPFAAWNIGHYNTDTSMVTGPCGYVSVPLRVRAGCKMNTTQVSAPACLDKGFNPGDYVCFAAAAERALIANFTIQATPYFSYVSEAQDPKFYSSCVLKSKDYGFDPKTFPAYPAVKPKWQAGAGCIPCQFLDQVNALNTFNSTWGRVPNWERATLGSTQCTPCY